MSIVAIIPARMASTRFPGKPLSEIHGLPMIEHVRRRVGLCKLVDEVVVATCDKEIFNVVVNNGGRAIMTADTHERCTDRVAEAALSIKADIIVNVQGDEPLVRPEMFEPLLLPFEKEPDIVCTNLMAEITDNVEFNSPDVVKTVCDIKGNAVYFSREPIPSIRKAGQLAYKKYKQLGIIAFSRDFLDIFSKLPPTPLEAVESVDMLRAVEHGYNVRMVLSPFTVIGVDTPADLLRAIQLMSKDDLLHLYI
jgi:3-deoxy-manno-octulosonate cytidylyltransferase (CMP-KDO synthetase)